MNRMSSRVTLLALALTAAAGPTAASAQLSGILGGALPNVASVGAGNAAGVLSYCVKNKLVNATSASSVLGKLTGKPGVKGSSGFTLGQAGTLQTDKSTLSLGSLKDKMKSKLCDMVLNHATSLI